MSTPTVTVEMKNDGIALIKMEDEENKNIFSDTFIHDFIAAIDLCENEYKPKVAVLTGLPDVFSGGAEKQTLMDLCDGKVLVKDLLISEKLVGTTFPVIAAVEGHAVGGGLVMAVCCDMILLSRESRYGAVFMSMGFTPGMGCTTLLEECMGPFIASEMMFSGKRFKGKELENKGVNVNYILPKTEVRNKAMDIALQIVEKNVKSIYLLKYALIAKKKKLLIDARVQEDFMHRLSFGFPETKDRIRELYGE
jgi:polyketide biosynthesis enoyl-CoA hydratase PksI